MKSTEAKEKRIEMVDIHQFFVARIDNDFKKSSLDGQSLLSDLYESCTNFRKMFYADDYEFVFPEKAMNTCPCNQSKGE